VRLEGLDQLKKSNDLIASRTRDLPACSIVPQPTTLPAKILVCEAIGTAANPGLLCQPRVIMKMIVEK
jgi:hypothetical protein